MAAAPHCNKWMRFTIHYFVVFHCFVNLIYMLRIHFDGCVRAASYRPDVHVDERRQETFVPLRSPSVRPDVLVFNFNHSVQWSFHFVLQRHTGLVKKFINSSDSVTRREANVLIYNRENCKVCHKFWRSVSKSESFMLLFCRSKSKLTFLKTLPAIFYKYVVALWLIQQIKI